MIYLASPYTTNNRSVRHARLVANALFVKNGFNNQDKPLTMYSPIIHGDMTEQLLGQELPYNNWIHHGIGMLLKADKMYVLCLPGWKESKGVALEIEFAQKENIPIVYIDGETLAQFISPNLWKKLNDN